MQGEGAVIVEVVLIATLKHAVAALADWQSVKEARRDEELALDQLPLSISFDRQGTITLDNQIGTACDDSVGFNETIITMESKGLLTRVPHPMSGKVQIAAECLVRNANSFRTANQAA